jgi:NADPH:quinone reductase-like Zn-dependent oxidoreductase
VTALQGLRDTGGLKAGQRVLINGASGGVGTFAVQIARSYGADVTAVCSTRNVELVRSLGASRVIDYTREDFTRGDTRYDLILDTVGNRSLADIRRVMTPTATYVGIGGGGPADGGLIGPLGGILKERVVSAFVSQKLTSFIAEITGADLEALNALVVAKKLTPVIDRTYPLEDTAAAVQYLEQGHARGKVVISVAAAQPPATN